MDRNLGDSVRMLDIEKKEKEKKKKQVQIKMKIATEVRAERYQRTMKSLVTGRSVLGP